MRRNKELRLSVTPRLNQSILLMMERKEEKCRKMKKKTHIPGNKTIEEK